MLTIDGASDAICLRDPYVRGIELYWDFPREEWHRTECGALAMVADPLEQGVSYSRSMTHNNTCRMGPFGAQTDWCLGILAGLRIVVAKLLELGLHAAQADAAD